MIKLNVFTRGRAYQTPNTPSIRSISGAGAS